MRWVWEKRFRQLHFWLSFEVKGHTAPFWLQPPFQHCPTGSMRFRRAYTRMIVLIYRFTPDIPCILYHGDKATREELRKKYFSRKAPAEKFPIVVTSYEIIMNDRQYLSRMQWKFIIIDEGMLFSSQSLMSGHRIKNLNCKLVQELKSYDSANRLLLTGTPLQNNLKELWSLLNFIVPPALNLPLMLVT